MINSIPRQRLQDAWRECERHFYHLRHAMDSLQAVHPFTAARYNALTDTEIQGIDQFILRFSKLQDAIANHLLPALLRYLQEPYEQRPMLDKLNRLEKLGFIHNVENWQLLRDIRNQFAHDYPDDAAKNAAQLNIAFAAVAELHSLLITIHTQLKINHPSLALDYILPAE